jgi:hypothetical protein
MHTSQGESNEKSSAPDGAVPGVGRILRTLAVRRRHDHVLGHERPAAFGPLGQHQERELVRAG